MACYETAIGYEIRYGICEKLYHRTPPLPTPLSEVARKCKWNWSLNTAKRISAIGASYILHLPKDYVMLLVKYISKRGFKNRRAPAPLF